ncbi:MAG: hypothetical protein QOH26_1226, partial [Actinomycetota bacterium]|nr:hypothetical protein [Actinomycetota bacterium]
MTDMVPGPAAETPSGDPEVGKTDPPWRGRDILFGVLAGFGGAFGFFIVYAVFVRASGVGSISGLAAFEFASIVSYVFLGAGLWFFALRRRGRSLRDAGFAKVGAGAVALMLPLTLGVLFVNGLIQLGVMELFGEIKTASDQLGVEEGSLNPSDV